MTLKDEEKLGTTGPKEQHGVSSTGFIFIPNLELKKLVIEMLMCRD